MREIPAQAPRNDVAYAVYGFKFELAGGDPARHGTRSLPSKDIESAIFAVPYVVGERVRRVGARGIGREKVSPKTSDIRKMTRTSGFRQYQPETVSEHELR